MNLLFFEFNLSTDFSTEMIDLVHRIRPPALAGLYYPAEKEFLAKVVDRYLDGGHVNTTAKVKAIIAPHAGYIFSGAVAGSAFRPWIGVPPPARVVIIAPSHSYDFPGIALPDAEAFESPLGEARIDLDTAESLLHHNFVRVFEAAHQNEHAIEVLLPFLQRTLGSCPILPLVFGRTTLPEGARVIQELWDDSLFLISSELSRVKNSRSGQKLDLNAVRRIANFRFAGLNSSHACGFRAIRPFLKVAAGSGLSCTCADTASVEGTAENPDGRTGLAAFHFYSA